MPIDDDEQEARAQKIITDVLNNAGLNVAGKIKVLNVLLAIALTEGLSEGEGASTKIGSWNALTP